MIPESPRPPLRLPAAIVVLALAAWALAWAFRLEGLDHATVGSDSLGQYLSALALQPGHLPPPPNPEAGYALWLWAWPLLHLAGSLEQLFALRFGVGALVAPIAVITAWWAGPGGVRSGVAAFAAGIFVAVDPGLRDTLVSAFRGYGAPEWMGLATLGLAAAHRGARWGAGLTVLALVGAAGQHPMAAGAALGLIGLFGLPRRQVGIALGLGALALLPRLLHLAWLADCGEGIVPCLGHVALGSSESLTLGQLLARALHDRLLVDLGPAALCLGMGLLLLGLSPSRRLLLPILGALVGLLLLGLSIHSLRPYHLRILAVPLAVGAGLGLSRLVWLPVPIVFAIALGRTTLPGAPEQAPQVHDEIARTLGASSGPIRVDGAWFSGPLCLEPAGVVLSAILQGQDPDRFRLDPDTPVLLLVSDPALIPPAWVLWGREGCAAIPFDDLAAARAWVDAQADAPPQRTGGAWDWWVALHPKEADLHDVAW